MDKPRKLRERNWGISGEEINPIDKYKKKLKKPPKFENYDGPPVK